MSTDAFELRLEQALRKGVEFRFRATESEDGTALEMRVLYLDAETSWSFEDAAAGMRERVVDAFETGIDHVARWEAAGRA